MKTNALQLEGFNLRKGVAAGALFFLVTGLVTGLLPNPIYIRKVPITVLDYFFITTTSVLAGIYFGREKCSSLDNKIGEIGGLTGFLAFGCPTCNAFFLTFLSSSAIMNYIDPLRPFLGLLSTISLIYLLRK